MKSDLVDRRLDGRELGEHLLAVGALLQHPLHAAQLALGAPEAHHELVGRREGERWPRPRS